MINLAYYGGMIIIAFGIWLWASSSYHGCDTVNIAECNFVQVLSIPAIQGILRNFLAFAALGAGWKLMIWAASKTVSEDKSGEDNGLDWP